MKREVFKQKNRKVDHSVFLPDEQNFIFAVVKKQLKQINRSSFVITQTTWKEGLAFESIYKTSSIQIDGSNGFSPKALLLSGLAGCTGIDIVGILEKMRVPYASLKINVQTEQTDSDPKVFKDIHIVFRLETEEENREKVKKAIELSLEKYCGVAAMLKKNSSISYTLELESKSL